MYSSTVLPAKQRMLIYKVYLPLHFFIASLSSCWLCTQGALLNGEPRKRKETMKPQINFHLPRTFNCISTTRSISRCLVVLRWCFGGVPCSSPSAQINMRVVYHTGEKQTNKQKQDLLLHPLLQFAPAEPMSTL